MANQVLSETEKTIRQAADGEDPAFGPNAVAFLLGVIDRLRAVVAAADVLAESVDYDHDGNDGANSAREAYERAKAAVVTKEVQ